jgi:hypothetical protein
VAGAHRRPAPTDDVLVESLARTHSEDEAAPREQRGRGRRLRDNGGVVAEEGAGHAGGEFDPLGAHGRGGEDRPGEAGVALAVEPGMVVVAYLHEVETRLLGAYGLADHLLRRIGFRDQLVSDLHVLPPERGDRDFAVRGNIAHCLCPGLAVGQRVPTRRTVDRGIGFPSTTCSSYHRCGALTPMGLGSPSGRRGASVCSERVPTEPATSRAHPCGWPRAARYDCFRESCVPNIVGGAFRVGATAGSRPRFATPPVRERIRERMGVHVGKVE